MNIQILQNDDAKLDNEIEQIRNTDHKCLHCYPPLQCTSTENIRKTKPMAGIEDSELNTEITQTVSTEIDNAVIRTEDLSNKPKLTLSSDSQG